MAASITIKANYLARNPIVVAINAGTNASSRYRIYSLLPTPELQYEGVVYTAAEAADIDISSVFGSLREDAGVAACSICLVDDEDVESLTETFNVFCGGISKLMIRKLAANSTDIFSWKLKNNASNFFLTTRTNGRLIYVPEDELLPLSFYRAGMYLKVKVDNEYVWIQDYKADTSETLHAWDFANLRAGVIASKNKIASVFDIMTETGGYACTVIITEAKRKAAYFLKFKNSWGVFEKIAIEGLVTYTPTFSTPDAIQVYDSVIEALANEPQRKELTNVYTAEIGYKTADERMFILDMLLSKTCYLLANGVECRASVAANSTVWQDTGNAPTAIQLTITLTDVDENYSALNDGTDMLLGTLELNPITANEFKIKL